MKSTRCSTLLLLLPLLAACGGEAVDVGETANNGATNNGSPTNNGATNNGGANNGATNNGATNNGATNNGANNGCADTTLYADNDGDGFGTSAASTNQCVGATDQLPGYARQQGDCNDAVDWVSPGADDVCGDNLDENCDPGDDTCPTTNAADVDVPAWDCTSGAPPSNVLAFARFSDGGDYFHDNGCFVVFEGLPGEFYATRHLSRSNTDPGCDGTNGCTCPSVGGWPSYDRRLYAFLLEGTPEACEPISLVDHGGETQVVSNDCRKYFYQLHWPGHEIPFSYVASGEASVRQRLTTFGSIEIACAEDAPHDNLPFASLMTAAIEFNAGFVKK